MCDCLTLTIRLVGFTRRITCVNDLRFKVAKFRYTNFLWNWRDGKNLVSLDKFIPLWLQKHSNSANVSNPRTYAKNASFHSHSNNESLSYIELKPGFYISEGTTQNECKMKDMNTYTVTEVKHTKLILHDIKSVILVSVLL
jgi:hypothetical protein